MKTHDYSSVEEYKSIQIKRHEKTRDRTVNRHSARMNDIERIKAFVPDAKSVLCLGCRQLSEIRDFESKGFLAKGVDLLNGPDPYIEVMDMHDIANKWGPNSWDVIYMSHSLEHSNDPIGLFQSIASVSKLGLYVVLPIQDEPDEKDPTVFNFMHSQANAFEEEVVEELQDLLGCTVDVEGLVYRHTSGADEMSFFVRFDKQ